MEIAKRRRHLGQALKPCYNNTAAMPKLPMAGICPILIDF
jgi:hypothetical protein